MYTIEIKPRPLSMLVEPSSREAFHLLLEINETLDRRKKLK